MAIWTHAICEDCWNIKNPDRPAVKVAPTQGANTCCFCGVKTSAGIFVRHNPAELTCQHIEE